MFLFFDIESNGLPKNFKSPMTEVDNWPRVIQLAFMLCNEKGEILSQKEYLITPDCWEIPTEPFWIEHGFNTAKSKKEGVPLRQALVEFLADLEQSEYLIAHNMDFDKNVLGAELLRYEMKGKKVTKICTMATTVDFCAIPFGGERAWLSKKEKKYKWAKLSELHVKLFGRDFDAAHSAGGDVAALKNCFFELVRLGVIKLEPQNVKS